MPKKTFASAYTQPGGYATGAPSPESVLAFHRATFGDARMNNDGAPGGESEQPQQQNSDGNDTANGEQQDGGEDLGFPADTAVKDMTVEQQAAYHRHQSQKWEQRAKASDRVARDDYDKVVAERDKLRQANETDHEKALREAKDAGASEAREQVFTETATAMLRMALRGHGITKDDDLDEIVAATNLAHFKGDDGAIDDQKVAALAKRMAGTAGAQQWPDMGQDKSGSSKRTGGMAAGSEAWEELHGKKPNTNS